MPTIEEDLDLLQYATSLAAHHQAAITRIRAALADMEHLEKAARIAYQHLDYRVTNKRPVSNNEAMWLEAERARQSRKGGV